MKVAPNSTNPTNAEMGQSRGSILRASSMYRPNGLIAGGLSVVVVVANKLVW